MKSDYKMQGKLAQVTVQVEEHVAKALADMEKHSRFSVSEITNTALKRFITHHRDFLPANYAMPTRDAAGGQS
jgi:hypothetical protein